MYRNILFGVGAVALAAIVLAIAFPRQTTEAVTSFTECAAAGYPIGESYPRQCWTPDGGHFVEEVETSPEPDDSSAPSGVGAGCAVAGCSGQICTDAERASDLVTTCEYRPEYGCYKTARCERRSSGVCGWTKTTELSACLQNAETSQELGPQ